MAFVRITCLILIVGALGACQSVPQRYAKHDSRIVGTWYGIYTSPLNVVDYSEKTYLSDGSSCGFILDVSQDGHIELDVYKGPWKVKHNQLFSYTTASNSFVLLTAPQPIVDDIVSISANAMYLRMTVPPTTHTYARYKLAVDRGNSLCELADAVIGKTM